MMRLADGTTIDDWQRIVAEPPEVAYVEPLPDPAEVLAMRVAESIADLKDALNTLPAPQVQVAAPDLSAIVQAVTSLNGPATAEEIAEAVARSLHVPEPESQQPLIDAIAKAFEKMDHRMQGMVPAFGASGPSNISDNPNRQLGIVSWTTPTQSGDGEAISSSGSNTLHTPATGKKVRLRWIYLQATGAAVTATVKLGSSTLYVVDLSTSGVPVFSHSTSRLGATDAALTVTLSAAETVLTNFDVTEE